MTDRFRPVPQEEIGGWEITPAIHEKFTQPDIRYRDGNVEVAMVFGRRRNGNPDDPLHTVYIGERRDGKGEIAITKVGGGVTLTDALRAAGGRFYEQYQKCSGGKKETVIVSFE